MTNQIELSAEELIHVISSVNQSFLQLIEESMKEDLKDRQEEKEIILKLLSSHIMAQHAHLTEAVTQQEQQFVDSIMGGIKARREAQAALKN
jgi:hypothetical protein